MASDTGGIPLRAETTAAVRWSTAEALVERVRQLRSAVEQRCRYVVDRARQFHPIPAGLVVNPPIDVHLVDRRCDKSVPLPKIDQ